MTLGLAGRSVDVVHTGVDRPTEDDTWIDMGRSECDTPAGSAMTGTPLDPTEIVDTDGDAIG